MEFQRGQDPVKSMNLGKDRILQKYDTFSVIFPETPDQPEFKENAIALSDEETVTIHVTYRNLIPEHHSGVLIERQVEFSSDNHIGVAAFTDGIWKFKR